MSLKKDQSGFSIIEILLVAVAVGILISIVLTAYVSVHRNQNNQTRQNDIQAIYQKLEAYYVENSQYPTLADMNNSAWLTKNMPNLNPGDLKDPSGKTEQLVTKPETNAYAYEVTSVDGSTCNDKTVICAHYSLVATLDESSAPTFVKSSLN
ncbi:MAG TPA: prepilin-type N-terminal cleavage/methylation domain-containing protein [Candidatus Saccharimonadales bacterium]|nr:prepilin-type N-terminal cleavage/methylation domain-containing protein [Candidatus Saccharimonadales bacterium]